MSKTGWGTLGTVFTVAFAVAFTGIRMAVDAGLTPPAAPWLTLVLIVFLAGALLVRGRGVKKFVAHEDTSMTALGAARTLVLAKTSLLVGSLIGGYFAAQLLLALVHPPAPIRGELLLSAGVGLGICVVLVVIAMLVESWCRIDPPENEDGPGRSGPENASPAGA